MGRTLNLKSELKTNLGNTSAALMLTSITFKLIINNSGSARTYSQVPNGPRYVNGELVTILKPSDRLAWLIVVLHKKYEQKLIV